MESKFSAVKGFWLLSLLVDITNKKFQVNKKDLGKKSFKVSTIRCYILKII